jgi:hypothetical protein
MTTPDAENVGERLARLEANAAAARQAVDAAFASLDKRLDAAGQAHAEAHAIEREVADRERAAMGLRLEGMNEFRQQLNEQGKTFATQEGMSVKFDQLAERLTQNREDTLARLAILERAIAARNEVVATHQAVREGGSELARWAIPVFISGAALIAVIIGLLVR